MRNFFQKNHRLVFYSYWILLTVIQAWFTDLMDDEAFYWVCSKFPDWGYFDHPPMIAMMIKLGYSIFPNAFGVRLFPAVLNVLSLFIIEKLIDENNPNTESVTTRKYLFYTIALSIAVFQIGGFMAVPDNPLIFFTAVFFLVYKKFLLLPSVQNSLLLGLLVAALLYSKYHGILVIFFVVLSNLKLFKMYQTYLVGLFAFILFLPHLWWLYQNDWISIKYQLLKNEMHKYHFAFTTEYIVGQLFLPGPIAGFILLPAAFLCKTRSVFERGLKFTLVGVYIFFLINSFRGRIEANWTSLVFVPLIVLSHHFLSVKIVWRKWLARLLPVTLILVLLARIVMIWDILSSKAIQSRFHSWHTWPQIMKEKTNGLPVVFSNSHQRAAQYTFHTGISTYSLTSYTERKSNYIYWPVADSLLGKPVYFLDIYRLYRFPDSLKTPLGYVGYKLDSSFVSLAKLEIKTSEKKINIKQDESFSLHCALRLPEFYYQWLVQHPSLKTKIYLAISSRYDWLTQIELPVTLNQFLYSQQTIQFHLHFPKGKYGLMFAISCHDYDPTPLSEKVELNIE